MNRNKTKIIATLGPASSAPETLLELMSSGVDVFRINFSHADYAVVEEQVKNIRELSQKHGYSTGILGDLQGPKLRIGMVEPGVELSPGDVLTFTNENIIGNKTQVYMTYENFPKDVSVGEQILVDDGKLVFKVIETNGTDTVKAVTIQGGPLTSKKGVNLPNTKVSLPALTEKDIRDVHFMMQLNIDWIALSFVRSATDIQDLKNLMKEMLPEGAFQLPIIAKIEKPEAISHLEEILDACDGVMVARGDLGVEIPIDSVPAIQKTIVEKARFMAKPVIIATQMMESMMNNLTPSRAEVNDVANSVLDGTDAVMLSGETSVGKYPVEVVKTMSKIISNIENSEFYQPKNDIIEKEYDANSDRFMTDRICLAAVRIAKTTSIDAIITLTHSGYTAFQISSHRPNSNIIVFSANKRVITMLNLLWGVRAFYYDHTESTDETIIHVNQMAHNRGYIDSGDFVINLNATPAHQSGKTNTLRLTRF